MNKSCIRCGAPLKENAIKYCSKRCYGDAKITKVERTCEVCGKPFLARHNAVEQGNGRFCTRACVNRSRAVPLDGRLDTMLAQSTVNENGCLIWGGPCDRAGYGVITSADNRQLRASHLVYEKFVAPIPDGQYVLHRCDNPPCVEPSHLWLGSKKENMLDMVQKGRAGKNGAAAPHKITEDDVPVIRARVASGETQTKVAKDFGIAQCTVSQIVLRKKWKHVP